MRKIVTIILAAVAPVWMYAQSLSPTVISSTGGFSSNANGSLSYTVGEMTMVQTFSAGGNILTQGFQQPNEREFFDKQYPHRKRSYYEVLGVTKNSSLADIQKAYRDLAIKYHPKNSSDPAAEQKFTEINEAYTHLSDAARRRAYDEYRFGELVPFTSHSIFNDFFNTRPFLAADDDKFFRPLMWKSPYEMQREFDKDWMEIEKLGSGGNTEYAETYKSSTVQERKPEGLVGKTVTEKSSIKDGKKTTVKTEEILKPDGTKEVTETVTEGTDTKTNKYLLGPGQERKAIGPSK